VARVRMEVIRFIKPPKPGIQYWQHRLSRFVLSWL
jgi:hypothetical protein